MNTKIVIAFFFAVSLSSVCSSQFNKKVTILNHPLEVSECVYFLTNSNEYFQVFRNENIGKAESIQDTASPSHFQYSLIFSNNNKIVLNAKEAFIDFNADAFITKEISDDGKEALLRRYEIKSDKIFQKGETKVSYQSNCYILSNGNVLINDFSENFGSNYLLFNKEMKLLNKIEPFENGFFSTTFEESNGRIFIEFQNSYQGNVTIISIDSENGHFINRLIFESVDFSPYTIKVSDKYIFLWGYKKLIAVSLQGKLLWQEEINLPNGYLCLFNDGKRLVAITDDGLMCFNSTTGQILWKKIYSEIYDMVLLNKPFDLNNIAIRVLDISPIDKQSSFAVIIGQSSEGYLNSKKTKLQDKVFIIDANARIIMEDLLDFKTYNLKLSHSDNQIKILTDKSIFSYEKK